MKKNSVIAIVALLVIVIALAIVFTAKNKEEKSLREEIIEQEEERPETTVDIKHQYKDGEHVFVGTLSLPSPCHSHNAEIVAGEKPEIKLTTTAPAADTVCAQVITQKDFKVTYKSDNPDLEFSATLNGDTVILNIFEVSPNDDIDTLELFLKG